MNGRIKSYGFLYSLKKLIMIGLGFIDVYFKPWLTDDGLSSFQDPKPLNYSLFRTRIFWARHAKHSDVKSKFCPENYIKKIYLVLAQNCSKWEYWIFRKLGFFGNFEFIDNSGHFVSLCKALPQQLNSKNLACKFISKRE